MSWRTDQNPGGLACRLPIRSVFIPNQSLLRSTAALGVESVAEYFDLELTRTLAEEEVSSLKQQLPPGMEVINRTETHQSPCPNGGSRQYLPVYVA